jgi:hypothetical protein
MATLRGGGVGDGLGIGATGEEAPAQAAVRIASKTPRVCFVITTLGPFGPPIRLYRKEAVMYSDAEHLKTVRHVPKGQEE